MVRELPQKQYHSQWHEHPEVPKGKTPKKEIVGKQNGIIILILSILVDTFFSSISLTMRPVPNPHNTACVLS